MDGWVDHGDIGDWQKLGYGIRETETAGTKLVTIDITGGRENLEKAAEMIKNGWLCCFVCGGVTAMGTSSPASMEIIGSRFKGKLADNLNKKRQKFETELEIPEPRKWGEKPAIYLMSREYLEKVADFERLEKILGLKREEGKKLVKDLYEDSLMHLVLPIKKQHAGKTIPFINEKETAGFMCLGGYPPLKAVIEKYEQIVRKEGNLPWPFMGSSMASRDMEPISTTNQALRGLEGIPDIEKYSFLLIDPEMDRIVEEEWNGRGNSQSLVDLTSKEGIALVIRRGLALPETVELIFSKYGLKIEYANNYMDLYPNELPPIATTEDWEKFRKRFDNTGGAIIMTEEECPKEIAA